MPIYEYHCASCGFQKEFLQKMSDPVLTKCPECSKETLSKMVTAAAFKLKGSGWYATDFKNGNGSSPKPATQSTSSGESSESAAHSCGSGHCGVCS